MTVQWWQARARHRVGHFAAKPKRRRRFALQAHSKEELV